MAIFAKLDDISNKLKDDDFFEGVNIVYCKDCRYFHVKAKEGLYNDYVIGECELNRKGFLSCRREYDYCSYGSE